MDLFAGTFSLLGSFFTTLCVVAAILWLTWRASLVADKPLDELVQLLGFEIPQGPVLDLAAVRADAATIHWTPADDRKLMYKYHIQVNGASVGEVSHSDSCIVITNLEPDHKYIVRIIIKTALDFRTVSDPVRFKTKALLTGDFFRANVSGTPNQEQHAASTHPGGIVLRPYKSLSQAGNGSPTPIAMSRETSNHSILTRRTLPLRNVSPAINTPENQTPTSDEAPWNEGYGQELTASLEEVTKEIADLERQIADDEREADIARTDLARERDEIRSSLRERDINSRDLRKQVNALERDNAAAQNRKSIQARLVQQKHAELKKMDDQLLRWGDEMLEMQAIIEQCADNKETLKDSSIRQRLDFEVKQAEEASAIKALEEDIREKFDHLKRTEKELTKPDPNPDDKGDHSTSLLDDRDQSAASREAYLDAQYKSTYSAFEGAKRLCSDAYAQLKLVTEQNRHSSSNAMHLLESMIQRPISRSNSARQSRASNSGTTQSSGSAAPLAGMSYSNGLLSLPGAVQTSQKDPSYDELRDDALENSSDHSLLTNLGVAAPVDPSAGVSLLPSGLFNAADEETTGRRQSSYGSNSYGRTEVLSSLRPDVGSVGGGRDLPGLGAFASSNLLPGLGAANVQTGEITIPRTTSPISVASHSPGVHTSPGLMTNQTQQHSPETNFDVDRRSIQSARSLRASSGGVGRTSSRFSHILGLDKINRQRGKTLADDGLALGSLVKEQTQSAPRAALAAAALSMGRRRNSNPSSDLSNLTLGGGYPRVKPLQELDGLAPSKFKSQHRTPFRKSDSHGEELLTGSFQDTFQSAPSRPVSSHSGDIPFNEGASRSTLFPNDSTSQIRLSPLGQSWGQSVGSMSDLWRPKHSSRPSSLQHVDTMDTNSDAMSYHTKTDSAQAPIGTKPSLIGLRRSQSPPLNPAAQDFKSLFGFVAEKKDKSVDSSRRHKKLAKSNKFDVDSDMLGTNHDQDGQSYSVPTHGDPLATSPSPDRRSRDTRSTTTVNSSTGYSSRNSLDKTPSQTPSDVLQTPNSQTGSLPRESFMQKLGRKSSSGKFGLPVFQREKKSRHSVAADVESLTEPEDRANESESSLSALRFDGDTLEDDEDKKRSRPALGAARIWSAKFATKIGKSNNGRGGKARNPGVPTNPNDSVKDDGFNELA